MAVKTKIDPIAKELQLFVSAELSPAAQSRAIAGFARDELNKAKQKNRAVLGQTPPHETYVDGAKNTRLEAVKPNGVIVFEFELFTSAIAWCMDQLVKHSPKLTGRYRQSWVLYADGIKADLAAIKPAERYAILNVQPYSRKLERAIPGAKGWSKQAPEGVVDVVVALARKRFGNTAKIYSGWQSPTGNYIALNHKRMSKAEYARKRPLANAERDTRVPAVIIYPR